MNRTIEQYITQVEYILFRDYIERNDTAFKWVKEVVQKTDMDALYNGGYTEEAAAQKVFEENF